MTEIKDNSLQNYFDTLASKNATPGGGSAAALMGAQAAALVSMVCNLTIGKPKYIEIEAQMQDLLEKSEKLREDFTKMIKADVDVFNRLMETYSLPKETNDEKEARSVAIQLVLKDATDVPLECAKASVEVIKLSRYVAENGNTAVISDAGVGVMSAYAALKSAALNVYINAANLKDKNFATQKLAELEILLNGSDIACQEIYDIVKSRL